LTDLRDQAAIITGAGQVLERLNRIGDPETLKVVYYCGAQVQIELGKLLGERA
jgi:hypothetical protein